jgi:hypothetical protein
MRKLPTDEGMIENACERLQSDLSITENTQGYVLMSDAETLSARSIASPRLAHAEQAREFQMQVLEDATKAEG